MGKMRIRSATLDDVKGIVEVHTAREKLYGNLHELYSKGGPWMAVETLAVHLNDILLDNQLVAVAELEGRIIGEVEAFFSKESIGGDTKRMAHIDVIEVHPEYRGMGVGKALMEFVEEVAKERKAELLTVQPDEEAEGFYRRLGFDGELFRGRIVRIPAIGEGDVKPARFYWDDVRGLELVAGRFQSSYSVFFSAFRDNIAGIHYTVESGISGSSYYTIRNLPGRKGCALFLWGRLEDLSQVLRRARDLGFESALTVVPEGMTSPEAEEIGKIKILGKALT